MTDRLLALDFDGVVADSAPEAFLVSLRTYAALCPQSGVARHAEGLEDLPSVVALRSSPLYTPFLESLPLGNRAEDFGVVLAALEAGISLPDQATYDAFHGGHDEAWLANFHRHFYLQRDEISARHPEGWLELMAPFAPLVDVLRARAGDATLAIATARDRRSVQVLLDAYGIGQLVDDALLVDKEAGRNKCAHLRILATRSGIPPEDTRFLDDKVNHLRDVAELGVGVALAGWGYNGAREHALAREYGLPVCSFAEAEAWGFD